MQEREEAALIRAIRETTDKITVDKWNTVG
jgi:hypothetical protein